METHPPQPCPTFTLNDLDHIRREVLAACVELQEMIRNGDDIRQFWDKPRKYFVPEIGTWIPFPKGPIWRLVEPVYRLPESNDPVVKLLVKEIISSSQWWEYVRREIIPYEYNQFQRRSRLLHVRLHK